MIRLRKLHGYDRYPVIIKSDVTYGLIITEINNDSRNKRRQLYNDSLSVELLVWTKDNDTEIIIEIFMLVHPSYERPQL